MRSFPISDQTVIDPVVRKEFVRSIGVWVEATNGLEMSRLTTRRNCNFMGGSRLNQQTMNGVVKLLMTGLVVCQAAIQNGRDTLPPHGQHDGLIMVVMVNGVPLGAAVRHGIHHEDIINHTKQLIAGGVPIQVGKGVIQAFPVPSLPSFGVCMRIVGLPVCFQKTCSISQENTTLSFQVFIIGIVTRDLPPTTEGTQAGSIYDRRMEE